MKAKAKPGPAKGPAQSAGGRAFRSHSGRPLAPSVRTAMEAGFGHDFGSVRVHADVAAAGAARHHRAAAFAAGPEIVFAAGRYRPDTSAGRRLLAHELAHTVQQPDRIGPGTDLPPPSRGGEAVEREADHLADAALARIGGGAADVAGTALPAPLPTVTRSTPRLLRAGEPGAAPEAAALAPAPAVDETAEVEAPEAEAAAEPEEEEADPLADFYDCDAEEQAKITTAVRAAKGRAKQAADRLDSFSRLRVRRQFERFFGDKSEEARNQVLAVLRGVAGLATTTNRDAAGRSVVYLGCARCGTNAAAAYSEPEIVRSSVPPHLETVQAPARIGFCSGFFNQDNELRNEIDTLHEMVHAVQHSNAVDVYYSSRLFESLGRLATAEGPAYATINPDSITAFAYFSLASFRGIGEGSLSADEVDAAFPGAAKTVTSGFAGKGEQRTQARAALGLMETWVDVADKRLGSLLAEIDGYVDPEWNQVTGHGKATAALLAGGEVDRAGGFGSCGTSAGFPAACPAEDGLLGGAEAVIRNQLERLATLRQRLSGKPTPEEVADAGGEADQLPEERSIRLKRRRRDSAASFKLGEDPESGRDRASDSFRLPESFFTLPGLGDQAEVLLRIYVDGVLGGGDVEPLVTFILRNARRADQPSARALTELGRAPLRP